MIVSGGNESVVVRGLAAARVERPADRAELARCLKESEGAVVPVGGATRLPLGGPLDAPSFVAFDLTGLDRVIDHAADDLTITVEAGITLENLARVLESRRQWLPIDPPCPEKATVGGLVATAAWGPLRPFGATPRRHLIGITVMDGDGVERRAGGRVVKNVAGYDMMKLHAGALGTLGIVVEVSFRVHPLPETEILLLGRAGDLGSVARLASELNRSDLEPSTFLAYDSATASEMHGDSRFTSPLGLAIGFLGFEEDVAWCADELDRIGRLCGITLEHRLRGDGAARFRSRLTWAPGPTDIELCASALPTQTFDLLHDLADAIEAPRPGAGEPPLLFLAHPGIGVVRTLVDERTPVTARSLLQAREEIGGRGGHLIVESCPDSLARELDVWGDPGPARETMAGIKQALDPRRRLNPGRFAGGL